LIVLLLGAFALFQATTFKSVLAASLYAYTVYGAAVTPVVLAVFFWKRTTTSGAITSIVLGAAITIVWNLAHWGDIVWPSIGTSVDAVYPALAASVLSLIIVSLLTPPPAKEKWEQFSSPAAG
jgi:SSS family solute:Na+ symporter/sodium/proline symporter